MRPAPPGRSLPGEDAREVHRCDAHEEPDEHVRGLEPAGRVPGDEVKYNEIALRVMKRHGVAIDDLYTFALPRLAEIQLPANVHFKPEGSKQLASHIAANILKHLDSK